LGRSQESPWWRSNVLEIFPGQQSVRFLPTAWLAACTRESLPSDALWLDYPAGSTFMGVDIGGAVGYFGAGKGGKLHVNRRTANEFAIRRRLDPHRENHVPFYCGGIPEWPALRQELAELRSPTMEYDEGEVKQRLEDKEELAARLQRSPDLLDALLMTFTYSD
jgi:hypothetical protein